MDVDLAAKAPEGLVWIALGIGAIFTISNIVGLITGRITAGRRNMRREIAGWLARVIAALRLFFALPMLILGLAAQFDLMFVSGEILAGSIFLGTLSSGLIDFVGVLVARPAPA
jgi:hypothetical protein